MLSFNLNLLVTLLSRTLNWWWLEILVGRIGGVVVFAGVGIIMRIMQNNIWWQSLDYPFMLESFVGGEALFGIPFEAAANKINKRRIRHLSQLIHDVAESLLLLIIRQHF